MNKKRLLLRVCVLLFCAAGALGFAVPARGQGATPPPSATRPVDMRVLILEPYVRGEQVTTEEATTVQEAASFALALRTAARSALEGHRVEVLTGAESPEMTEATDRLQPLRARLARGLANADTAEGLRRFAAVDGRLAVLSIFLRVKIGPGKSWNPNTGQITASASTMQLSAALFGCEGAPVLWKNELVIRGTPSAGSKDFKEKVSELFKGL
jgi:hypothetical protein